AVGLCLVRPGGDAGRAHASRTCRADRDADLALRVLRSGELTNTSFGPWTSMSAARTSCPERNRLHALTEWQPIAVFLPIIVCFTSAIGINHTRRVHAG